MRTMPSALRRSVTTTCLCWRLTRTDGFVIGLTDHDVAIEMDGLRYDPGAAFKASAFTATDDLRPSRANASGSLSSDALREDDLIAGLWDDARVDVFRADWQQPEARVLIWSGRLSEITHGDNAFEVELVSLKADFERPVGRVYSRRCDAVLGDARCGAAANGRLCDQRFETCRDVFSNTENFRGFPHLPGPDAVLAGPAAAGNTGNKR